MDTNEKRKETYLTALKDFMEKKFGKTACGIGWERDSAVCIVEENNKWHVFDYDRGNRFAEVEFDNIVDACFACICRANPEPNDSELIEEFLKFVTP